MAQKIQVPKRRRSKALSGWHAEDVKAAIRKKGMTLAELSRIHEYSDSYLRGTLIRHRPQGEVIIAHFLGISPAEIWPERYSKKKVPKTRNGRRGKREKRKP
ncbi:MAG TPA: helix-turn-helix domain-containing protein [Rhizomicrobium sp.]|jgi:Ner family transcriptional regulator